MTPDPAAGSGPPRWCEAAFAATVLVTALVLCLLSMRELGPTFDEVAHIAAGVDHIQRGEYVLNVEHPPLVKQIAGLALAPLHLRARLPAPAPHGADAAAHYRNEQWLCGRDLLLTLNGGRERTATILTVARLPVLALSALLLPILWLWARTMLGPLAAASALVLAALCPTWLAHARLVHTDAPLTMFTTAALAQAWWLRRRFSWPRAAGLGAICGLALCTKYSALILGPMIAASTLAAIALHRPGDRGLWREAPAGRIQLALQWLATGTAVVLVAAVPVALCTARFDPGWWLRGYDTLFEGHRAGYLSYLAGHFQSGGFWLYFPLAILLKMTLPALALIAIGAAALRVLDPPRRQDLIVSVLVPAAVFFAALLSTDLQIGVRHALPLFPLLFLLAAAGVEILWRRSRLHRAVLALLLGLHAAASIRAAPDWLAFFNLAAGGARHGWHWLDDSNVDWGQDLPALTRWREALRAREPEAVAGVSQFGPIQPHEWSTAFERPDIDDTLRLAMPDWDHFAISAHMLVRHTATFQQRYGLAFPWADERLISGWIRTSYALIHLRRAGDGSGDVIVEGPEPTRIPIAQWLAAARERAERMEARDRESLAAVILLRWQLARFHAKWADGLQRRRSFDALDELLRGLRERSPELFLQLPAPLLAEMAAHLRAEGDLVRARLYTR